MKRIKHTSYRGIPIDMESLRKENETVPAMGNMNANARGDILGKGGVIAKTVDEIARDNHRVRTAVKHTGLKGPQPESLNNEKKPVIVPTATGPTPPPKKPKEVVADNRDIIIEDEGNSL